MCTSPPGWFWRRRMHSVLSKYAGEAGT
jgi:hypothetical protein